MMGMRADTIDKGAIYKSEQYLRAVYPVHEKNENTDALLKDITKAFNLIFRMESEESIIHNNIKIVFRNFN